MGVLNPEKLREAVAKDHEETGEPLIPDLEGVRFNAERLNALRKGDVH